MRGPKAAVDPLRPVAFFAEEELGPDGTLWPTNTVLLANRECPFRCVYCDLWKHTLDEPTPPGAIPAQLDVALSQLPPARQVKLYNAGNWFDAKAIPPQDHAAVAERLRGVERVVIENHPKLCDDRVLAFRDRLDGQLEVAVGVETVDPAVLSRLDKSMTLGDVERAVDFMTRNEIAVRAFILLPPPFVRDDPVPHAVEAARWSFDAGCDVAVLIPLRADTDAMRSLAAAGDAVPPSLEGVERAMREAAPLRRPGQRLFVDLWDAEKTFGDEPDASSRLRRLRDFNDGLP